MLIHWQKKKHLSVNDNLVNCGKLEDVDNAPNNVQVGFVRIKDYKTKWDRPLENENQYFHDMKLSKKTVDLSLVNIHTKTKTMYPNNCQDYFITRQTRVFVKDASISQKFGHKSYFDKMEKQNSGTRKLIFERC